MTPQEKKRLSLKKDCRNTYGENDKSSRKSIRFRKRWVNRSYRREINQAVDSIAADEIQTKTEEVRRKEWKKCSDTPLGEKILREANWSMEHDLWQVSQNVSSFQDDFSDFLDGQNLSNSHRRIVERRVQAVSIDRNSGSLNLDRNDIEMLEHFLDEIDKIEQGSARQSTTAP